MKVATALNVGYGLFGLVTAFLTGTNPALIADSTHNALDGLAHSAHTKTHIKEHNHESDTQSSRKDVKRIRRIAGGFMIAASCLTGGYSLINVLEPPSNEIDKTALIVELGSLAASGALLAGVRVNADGTAAYRDARNHLTVDVLGSAISATSIGFTSLLPTAPGIGGFTASVLTFSAGLNTLLDTHQH